MPRIKKAVISVYDKKGIAALARGLGELGVEMLSTGGTARRLRDGGAKVTDISDYTGFPEILGGRVKTLHPRIHGGLLGIRDEERHKGRGAPSGRNGGEFHRTDRHARGQFLPV